MDIDSEEKPRPASIGGLSPARRINVARAGQLDARAKQSFLVARLEQLTNDACDFSVLSNKLNISACLVDTLMTQEYNQFNFSATGLNQIKEVAQTSSQVNQGHNNFKLPHLLPKSRSLFPIQRLPGVSEISTISDLNSSWRLQKTDSANKISAYIQTNSLPNMPRLQDSLKIQPAPYLHSQARSPQGGKGHPVTFPKNLYEMLADLEKQPGGTEIASFLPHGRAFAIHKPKELMLEVIPKHFRMSNFASFKRQLYMYSFQQTSTGPDKGAYFHKLFVRDQPHLYAGIRRKK